ncbi:MAG: MBL fold metallo-hydrolase [Candidatus Saganbacteria bacterium]|nr:MBL fold metallo-hydrolase [Candidatus Saganbacteria bacterium]
MIGILAFGVGLVALGIFCGCPTINNTPDDDTTIGGDDDTYLDDDDNDTSVADDDDNTTVADDDSSGDDDTTGGPPFWLKIHAIDVGHGDALLIQNGSTNMLIDCGDNSDGEDVVTYLQAQGVTELEYILVSHGHSDHIGGCDTVLQSGITANAFWHNGVNYGTATYNDAMNQVPDNIEHVAQVGETRVLEDASFMVLHSDAEYPHDDENNNSVVIQLTFGDLSFLFTGDCENLCGDETIANANSLSQSLASSYFKVPHHGSNDSSSATLLNAVWPAGITQREAVISCSTQYNFPDPEVVARLQNDYGATVHITHDHGNIVAYSDDGSSYTITYH